MGVVVDWGVVVFIAAEGSGAPTAISQRWPGCPCAGFRAAPVEAVVVGIAAVVGVCDRESFFCATELVSGRAGRLDGCVENVF